MYNIANLADYIVYRSLDQNKCLTSIQLYYISTLLYLWNFNEFERTPIRCGSRFLGSPDVEEHYPYGLGTLGIFSVPFCYPFDWKNFSIPVLPKENDLYSEFDEDIDFMINAFYSYNDDHYTIKRLAEKIRVSCYDRCVSIEIVDPNRIQVSYKENNYIPYSIIESDDIIRDTLKEYRKLRGIQERRKLYRDCGLNKLFEKVNEVEMKDSLSLKSIEESAKRHKNIKKYQGEYSEYCARTAGNLSVKVKYLDYCIDELLRSFKEIIDNNDYDRIITPKSFDDGDIPNVQLRYAIHLNPDERKSNLTFMNIINHISTQCGSGFYDILKYIEHDNENTDNRQLSAERNRIHIDNTNLFLPYSSFVEIIQGQGLKHAMSLANRRIGDEGVYEYLRKSIEDCGFFIFQDCRDNCMIHIYTLSENVLC